MNYKRILAGALTAFAGLFLYCGDNVIKAPDTSGSGTGDGGDGTTSNAPFISEGSSVAKRDDVKGEASFSIVSNTAGTAVYEVAAAGKVISSLGKSVPVKKGENTFTVDISAQTYDDIKITVVVKTSKEISNRLEFTLYTLLFSNGYNARVYKSGNTFVIPQPGSLKQKAAPNVSFPIQNTDINAALSKLQEYASGFPVALNLESLNIGSSTLDFGAGWGPIKISGSVTSSSANATIWFHDGVEAELVGAIVTNTSTSAAAQKPNAISVGHATLTIANSTVKSTGTGNGVLAYEETPLGSGKAGNVVIDGSTVSVANPSAKAVAAYDDATIDTQKATEIDGDADGPGVIVPPSPTQTDAQKLAAARTAVQNAVKAGFSVPQATANTEAAALAYVQSVVDATTGVSALDFAGVVADGTPAFAAATAGNIGSPTGTNGSFSFKITLSLGSEDDRVISGTLVIRATSYFTPAQRVADAITAIESGTFGPFDQADGNTTAAVKAQVETIIAGLSLVDVTTNVVTDDFTAAVAGTSGSPAGTDGEYKFTVIVTSDDDPSESDETDVITVVITATPGAPTTITASGVRVTAPVDGTSPVNTVTYVSATPRFTGVVAWTDDHGNPVAGTFTGGAGYTATVTLTAATNYVFDFENYSDETDISGFTVNGAAPAALVGTPTATTLAFSVDFVATLPAPDIAVSGTGLTAPTSAANGTIEFGDEDAGYSAITATTYTITNSGSAATSDLAVALGGTDANDFTLTKTAVETLSGILPFASGSNTVTFSLKPNDGLAAGTYGATITVSAGTQSLVYDVSFEVKAIAPNIAVEGDGLTAPTSAANGTIEFGDEDAGYSAITATTYTITNSGSAATSDLAVALGGTNANDFTLTKTAVEALSGILPFASGSNTVTFSLKPNDGLAAGTYGATITVSAGTQSLVYDVSFEVKAIAPNIAVAGDGLTAPTSAANGTIEFGDEDAGYSAITATTYTITNSGSAATSDLAVALGGTDANDFTLTKTAVEALSGILPFASGSNTVTFSLRPNDGLTTGTYGATITVSAGTQSLVYDVSFEVK